MKSSFFVGLFVFLLVVGACGQIRTEHKWLIGTWTIGNETVVFNENGTGSWGGINFQFSIAQTADIITLSAYYDDGQFWVYVLSRINDQSVELRSIYPFRDRFLLSSCVFSLMLKEPFEVGGNPSTAKIILIGETHAVDWILDIQIEKWRHLYHYEGFRHLFIEGAYFHGQLLNQWMNSDNDNILDAMFYDLRGTLMGSPVVKEFYRRIKREFPETIFHGIDIGHQYRSTGKRFLNYLIENGLQGSEQYILTQESNEQGRFFYEILSRGQNADEQESYLYEISAHVFRSNAMAQNFIREFDNLGNIRVMGIFGSAHTSFNRYFFCNVPTMAMILQNHYGEIIYFKNYRN